ncbi:MAG: hypothetical protein Kow0068_05760 [Marinilabiliales bacterium]
MIIVSFYYFITAKFFIKNSEIQKFTDLFLYFTFLSINPFFYLYTKSLTQEKFKISSSILLHFAPAFIVLVVNIIIKILGNNQTTSIFNLNYLKTLAVILYNFQILGYAISMIILLRKHDIKLKNYFSFKNNTNNLIWLKAFFIIYVVFSCLDLLVYYEHAFDKWEYFYYSMTIIFFSALGYFGVKQSDIYAQTIIAEEKENENYNNESKDEKRLLLSNQKSQELLIKITDYMQKEKAYQNPELSIFNLADALNINKTYISYVINNYFQENFNSFINRYRIEEAKKILLNKDYANYTIEAIANMVGFHSKSSFNSAFKKYTGTTPSSYKKLN